MRNRSTSSVLAGCLVGLAASAALAQPAPRNPQPCDDPTGAFPCDYQIHKYDLQPSPTVFKFQARISQAKLPVGEAVFNRVLVNVKRGESTLCTEEFTGVQVLDSVINLEIGRNMSCELDQVIAENPDLAFVLCLGGSANCLRPIQLGSTPYAIKSTFARSAQEAHVADLAGQANYAHRATADRDLYLNKELGYGYFDFATPADRGLLYSADASWTPYAQGGFLQWAPLSEPNPTLHICARDDASGMVQQLERLVLAARATETTGSLQVDSGGMRVTGPSAILGSTTVTGQVRVSAPSDPAAARGLDVEGDTLLRGTATVNSDTFVKGKLTVNGGDVTVGKLYATQIVVSDTFQARSQTFETPPNFAAVQGDFLIPGTLTVRTGGEIAGGLTVKDGVLNLRSGTTAANAVMARSSDASPKLILNAASGTTPSLPGGTQVVGDLTATGAFSVTGAATVGTTLRSNNAVTVGASTSEWLWLGKSTAFPNGGRGINFVKDATDDGYCGEIAYKPAHSPNALSIHGAGNSPNRTVRIFDIVDATTGFSVGSKSAVTADSTTLVLNAGTAYTSGVKSNGALEVVNAATLGTSVAGTTRVLRFNPVSGDEGSTGTIIYRPNWETDATLGIVGAGTAAGSRKISLWDVVQVNSATTAWTDPATSANLRVVNTSNTANAHAGMALRTGGSAAGDPFISMDINGDVGWSMGVDNTDNNFKLYTDWNFPTATSPALTVDSSGNVTIKGYLVESAPVCRDVQTSCSSNGNAVYLDRHSAACDDKERLVKWAVTTAGCGGSDIRVAYRCCK